MLKLSAVLAAAGLLAAAEPQPPAPSCSLVPGWAKHGEARSFEPDTLFEYMNGNAEGYLIYGFRKMNGISCVKEGVTFIIDISDMGDPDSAYGILTANRDARKPPAAIGMGGQIVPRRLIFAKGRSYVEIAANPEGDHTPALKAWAAALEKAVAGRTSVPEALSWFPTEKQTSLRLIPESVLGLRLLRRGYVGQYEYGKAFLVLEDSPETAGAVMQKLKARFGETSAAKIGDEAFQFTDKYLGRLAIFRKGRFVGGWANVAEGSDPAQLATALALRLKP
jgi:hypothetical protein